MDVKVIFNYGPEDKILYTPVLPLEIFAKEVDSGECDGMAFVDENIACS